MKLRNTFKHLHCVLQRLYFVGSVRKMELYTFFIFLTLLTLKFLIVATLRLQYLTNCSGGIKTLAAFFIVHHKIIMTLINILKFLSHSFNSSIHLTFVRTILFFPSPSSFLYFSFSNHRAHGYTQFIESEVILFHQFVDSSK